MRTLSSTLTTAQETATGAPIYKVVLSRTSQTTRGYDNSRILKITRTEEPNSSKTDIILNDSDGALTALDFEHYQAVISKGYATGVSRTAWASNTAYAIDDIRVPTTANGYQYRCSVAGTSASTGIDIDSAAIDRTGSVASGQTILSANNPANLDGLLNTIEVWAATNITGFKVGTFFLVSGTTYQCREATTIGAVTAGSKQTFGVNLEVKTGDLLGYYFDTGSLESTGLTGNSSYNWNGDSVTTGVTYDVSGAGNLVATQSVYGIGAVEPTWPTDLGVTVTDGTVTWEMDGNSGDEYSRAAPLRVRTQEIPSGIGLLKCVLHAIGLPDQLKEEKAIVSHANTSNDLRTVKELMREVAAAGWSIWTASQTWVVGDFRKPVTANGYIYKITTGGAGAASEPTWPTTIGDTVVENLATWTCYGVEIECYAGEYSAITLVWDSEDSLIDTFVPKESFQIALNESRWDKLQELVEYTKDKLRWENDGSLHIFTPTISGVSYNYEYKFNVQGDHNFWNKSVLLRFVSPNHARVQSMPNDSPYYLGTNTSAASYALAPNAFTIERHLASNAQATAIAEAMIERYELNAETGLVTVPPNVGQELWDYVKVTDSRASDTRVGNIQFIQDEVEVFPNSSRRPIWRMFLSFGRVAKSSVSAMMADIEGEGRETRLTLETVYNRLLGLIDELITNQEALFANDKILNERTAHIEMTPSDVTANRAFATTYTNNGAKPILVTISVNLSGAENARLYVDASADPPATTVAYLQLGATGTMDMAMTGIVPIGWKYRCNCAGGVLNFWHEVKIG